MSTSPVTTHGLLHHHERKLKLSHNIFIPFFRENLSIQRFREILAPWGIVQAVVVREKMVKTPHFFAFLTLEISQSTKQGRDLAKNLKANVSTFVSVFSNNSKCGIRNSYLELQTYMPRQPRNFFDSYYEQQLLLQDYEDWNRDLQANLVFQQKFDNVIEKVVQSDSRRQQQQQLPVYMPNAHFALWTPSIYLV
jgi:hypothetical protein